MASFEESHLISTGHKHLDGILTVGFTLFWGTLVLHIALVFRQAYHSTGGSRRHVRRGGAERRREIYLFLVIAVLAFLVVNGLKYEYLRKKLASWDEIRGSLEDFKDHIKKETTRKFQHREAPNSVLGRYYQPDVHLDEITKLAKRLKKQSIKIGSAAGGITPKFRDQIEELAGKAHNWKRSDNTWDNFKILVASPGRFFWTQQWFMGYVAWAFFVGTECRQRAIDSTTLFSFVVLGYLFGLSTMQSVFYVLLLLKPKVARRGVWMPVSLFTQAVFAMEAIALTYLPLAFPHTAKARLFNALQTTVVLLPVASQCCLKLWPDTLLRNFGSGRKGRRALNSTCFTLSTFAATLHLWAAIGAYKETRLEYSHQWWITRAGAAVLPSYLTHHSRIQTAKETGRSLWSTFGDHPWVSSVGVDVLVSAIGLCCWTVMNNTSARSMIKCSIYPWLDETLAAAEHAMEHTMDQIRDVTDEIYESSVDQAKHAFSTAKEAARRGSQDMKQRVSQLQARIGLADEDIDWQSNGKQPTRGRGRPAKNSANSRSRNASVSSARLRSRPRPSVSPVKKSASSRRSSRVRNRSVSRRGGSAFEDDNEPGTFSSTVEAITADTEVAGLTWGLFTIGGLGMASAAVFGAEEVN